MNQNELSISIKQLTSIYTSFIIFLFVMNPSNSEIRSISIIINDEMLFWFTLLGAYSNIGSVQPFLRIQLNPIGPIRGEGGLL